MENNIEKNIKKIHLLKKPWMHSLISFVAIFGLLTVFLFWQVEKNSILIENSDLEAPIINISPTLPGVLNALYVKEGDRVPANSQVALVGSQIISTETGGIVASAPLVLGAYFVPGQTVVSIVNDQEMEVVGKIDETKGLSDVLVGQQATFTVDAFPGKTYKGSVDKISATSDNTSIVFSISDKRPTKTFSVKVRFNLADYPELKNGMSAKITIHIK